MDREQVGGDHYRSPKGIPEHWDIAVALDWDFFQYQITKYLWRWKEKGGVQDLEKAQHFLKKYLEVIKGKKEAFVAQHFGDQPGPGYVNQDPDVSPPRTGRGPTSAEAPAAESVRPGIPWAPLSLEVNGILYVQAHIRNRK